MQEISSSTSKRVSTRNAVAVGSVWETRMKMDEVKGGIKVFNGSNDEDRNCKKIEDKSSANDEGMILHQKVREHQTDGIGEGRRKRRSWGPPEPAVSILMIDKAPIQLRKPRTMHFRKERPGLIIGADVEEGRNFDDKEMDQSVEKLRNVDGEQNNDKIPEVITDAEKTVIDVLKEKIEKHQKPAIALSAETEKKQNVVFQAQANLEKKQPLAAVSWHKVERKKNLVFEASSNVENKQNSKLATSTKDNPVIDLTKRDQVPRKLSPSAAAQEEALPTSQGKHRLQDIVDLVMWKQIPKSTLAFGFGTFILISSSYSQDFNFSLISITSYIAFIYLASIFLYKSILNRGEKIDNEESDERYIVGEEEAIRRLRLILPCINELLSSLKALFTGDPATTMKLALLLLVMAKWGSSVTTWTLVKLTFFGVFTIPKFYSSYHNQLATYGQYYLEKFRDRWERCNHKKAVVITTFIFVWNISSTIARIWAVFMLTVAMKLYQKHLQERQDSGQENWLDEGQEDHKSAENKNQGQGLQNQHADVTAKTEVVKELKLKKGF